jgi:hypothetical protein
MVAPSHRALLAGLALCLLAPFACVAGAPDRPPKPPALLPEFRSAQPTPGMVWVAGAWHWDGIAYVWVPGRWESPPPIPEKS